MLLELFWMRTGMSKQEIVFENVGLSFISIHFWIKKKGLAVSILNNFHAYLLKNSIDPKQIKGSINHHDGDQLSALINLVKNKLPNFKIYTANLEGTIAAEIPNALARAILDGSNYLAKSDDLGIEIKQANKHLQFSVSVGTSYFLEIAKIRALKILWANVLEAYGLKSAEMPVIEAHLSDTVFGDDPNTNMIRSTTQAMSAVLGGVNRLTVLPSDIKTGKTTDFSKRIARNVQHLLMMESFMDRVVDPAKGSYYIEKLTEKIAEAAWSEIQKIENN